MKHAPEKTAKGLAEALRKKQYEPLVLPAYREFSWEEPEDITLLRFDASI